MERQSKEYKAGHKRVAYWLGYPSICENCGRTDNDVKYNWANLSGRYGHIEDYVRVCKPCHASFDNWPKLTDDDVREIRRRYTRQQGGPGVTAGPNSTYGLAKEFGVDQATISKIINRRTWTHVKDEVMN